MKTFNEKCYDLLKKVPKGKVTTYKEIANALGNKAYRAVGNAMNKNPYNHKDVPCHRVVNSNGSLGGFAFESKEKIRRLNEDGIEVRNDKIVNFKEKLFTFY